jgi:hypothetical protein
MLCQCEGQGVSMTKDVVVFGKKYSNRKYVYSKKNMNIHILEDTNSNWHNRGFIVAEMKTYQTCEPTAQSVAAVVVMKPAMSDALQAATVVETW